VGSLELGEPPRIILVELTTGLASSRQVAGTSTPRSDPFNQRKLTAFLPRQGKIVIVDLKDKTVAALVE
jgi:hypothetical protein